MMDTQESAAPAMAVPFQVETWRVEHGPANARITEWFLVQPRGKVWDATQPHKPDSGFAPGRTPREAVDMWLLSAGWEAPVVERVEDPAIVAAREREARAFAQEAATRMQVERALCGELVDDPCCDAVKLAARTAAERDRALAVERSAIACLGEADAMLRLLARFVRERRLGSADSVAGMVLGDGPPKILAEVRDATEGRAALDGWPVEMFMRAMAEEITRYGAKNFLEWKIVAADLGIALRVERLTGKAPGELLAEANAEVARLRAEVERLDEAARMACESPVDGCDCAGCSFARERGGAS